MEARMRVFRTALGIAGFLIVPWASADYSFSCNTGGQHDRAGASSSPRKRGSYPSAAPPAARRTSSSREPGTATSGQPVAAASAPSHRHSALDVRGSNTTAPARSQSIAGGTDSFSHHRHGSGHGDTSTTLSQNIVGPTKGYAGDPMFGTGVDPVFSTDVAPVFITSVDIAGAILTLNTTIDPLNTAPSLNNALLAPDPIPEPGTLALVGLALVAIAILPRRKSR